MEILSTGQKIKRARIYKGLTLKDICDNKISVSKMSCIENDKIKPDDEVLELISGKLSLKSDYLKEGVKEQITNNLKVLENSKKRHDYENLLEYNLKYAEEYSYFDLAFEVMHRLFNYYLDSGKLEKLQINTSKYYDYWQKSDIEKNATDYYMDVARYFFTTSEFAQAANYYNNVRKSSRKNGNNMILAKATYNESACYVMLEDYERAYEISVRLIDLCDYMDSDLHKAEAYHMLALLSIRMDKGKFEEYEAKSYELYKDDAAHKALAIYNYAAVMFEVGSTKKALEYINRALQTYPRNDEEKYVRFMILVIGELVENNILDLSQSVCDDALNYAIKLDNLKLVERAYYFKSIILEKQESYDMAEMYMNLSFDALRKFGNNQDIYKRYLKLGDLYYKLGDTYDSLKYFNLAIKLEKKL